MGPAALAMHMAALKAGTTRLALAQGSGHELALRRSASWPRATLRRGGSASCDFSQASMLQLDGHAGAATVQEQVELEENEAQAVQDGDWQQQ